MDQAKHFYLSKIGLSPGYFPSIRYGLSLGANSTSTTLYVKASRYAERALRDFLARVLSIMRVQSKQANYRRYKTGQKARPVKDDETALVTPRFKVCLIGQDNLFPLYSFARPGRVLRSETRMPWLKMHRVFTPYTQLTLERNQNVHEGRTKLTEQSIRTLMKIRSLCVWGHGARQEGEVHSCN